MTDQLETVLRAAFEADSTIAPTLGAHDYDGLTRTARARVRARRRRTALVAGSAALAAAVVVPFAAVRWDGLDEVAPPAGLSQGPARTPSTAFVPVSDGFLHFRGIRVPVTKAMLDPDNRDCGSSVADAAWWQDQHTGTRLCLVTTPTDGLTEVELRATDDRAELAPTFRESTLDDGRTRISVGFPERHVVLVVTSPLAQRAQETADAAEQLPLDSHILGCSIKDPSATAGALWGPAAGIGNAFAPDPSVAGVVCGYREGWLVDVEMLGAVGATEMARAFNAAPAGRQGDVTTLECNLRTPAEGEAPGSWQLQLVPKGGASIGYSIGVDSCSLGPVRREDGRNVVLSAALAATLHGLAVGPLGWAPDGKTAGE